MPKKASNDEIVHTSIITILVTAVGLSAAVTFGSWFLLAVSTLASGVWIYRLANIGRD